MLVFMEGGKPENPEKNPRSKDEKQQQTQPTYDTGAGNRTRATLVEGERSHQCAIPAPQSLLPQLTLFNCNGVENMPDSFEDCLLLCVEVGAFV